MGAARASREQHRRGAKASAVAPDERPLDAKAAGLLLVAFAALAFLVYAPSLSGGFTSDDWVVIAMNPYVHELDLENLVAILDPWGPPIPYAMNYSPAHLLVHAAENELFGDSLEGHRAVNVVLHATTSVLVVLLLAGSGVSRTFAILAGTLFLVHPANVESVAMIFQAKTTLSTALALGALLAFWRHPLAATALFALALLTKFTAVFALPAAAVMMWARAAQPGARVPLWGWLALWAGIFAVLAVPEFAAFERAGQGAGARVDWELFEHVRTIVAFAGRYLWIAATSIGVSPFHEPAPASSWSDPRWLAGLVVLSLLGWRLGVTLVRREEEAVYWVLALAAFAPISQVFPFPYPMADRYLYAILPGLLGGVLLAARAPARRIDHALRARFPRVRLAHPRAAALVALALLCTGFALRTHDRAPLFVSDRTIAREAVRHYPDGVQAWIARARDAAQRRDAAAAAAALREVERRGHDRYPSLSAIVQPVADDPRVRRVLDRMAEGWVGRLAVLEDPYPFERLALAQAQLYVGRPEDAIAVLEAALATEPREARALRETLRRARTELSRRPRRGPVASE